jgi:hypothetical protein
MIKKNVNETLGFNFYKHESKKEIDENGVEKTVERDIVLDDIKLQELFDKNIGKRMREMVELETRAKKEIELAQILDEITYKWDQVVRFAVDSNTKEIQKPDQIFDEIDDSFAKVADIQSNK